ncbi:MAG TPA: AAA family ATPase [Candidatus Aquicultor sp.]|jgi:hypothetical protein
MKPIDKVLAAVPGQKKKNGKGYMCHCPAHNDRNPSLEVKQNQDGKVSIKCHAGCDFNDVLSRIGLTAADLYPDIRVHVGPEIIAEYDYKDAQGKLRYQIVRKVPKSFLLRRPDSNGGWLWNKDGIELIPYNLSAVVQAIEQNKFVCIVEGEKDADTLSRLGITATCNPFGAGKWPESFAQYFHGAHIAIIPDQDEPGRLHGLDVARKLSGATKSIRIVDVPTGKDVTDYINAGGTDASLKAIVKHTVELDINKVSPVPSLYSNRDSGTLSIRRLRDIDEPAPMEFIVEDFVPENYPTMFYGDGGQGKSYLILCLGSCVAEGKEFLDKSTKKGNVLYVDFELDEAEQARRAFKVARGLGLERPPEGLFYFSPVSQDKAVKDIGAIIDELVVLIAEHDIKLTIIDSFGAAVAGDPESARDVTGLFRNLRRLGTTIILDHQSKASADKYKDKTAFGSVYKQNMSRNIWQLQRMLDTVTADNEMKLALHHKKSNFGPLRETICLKATFGHAYSIERVDPDIDFSDALSTKDQVFMAFAELGSATAKQVADEYLVPLKTVKNKITALKQEGKLRPTGAKDGQADVYEPTVPVSPIYKDKDAGEQLTTDPVITEEGRCEYDF